MNNLKYFIFLSYLFINLLSQETFLSKYGKTSTKQGYIVFDSSSFSNGDKMYFTLSAGGSCYDSLKTLYYTYLSSATESPSSIPYSVEKDSDEKTSLAGSVTSFYAFFTIEKKKDEFSNSNGEYLYLKYKCNDEVEIESTKMSGSKLVIIIVVVVAVVGITLLSIYLYYRRKRAANLATMNNNSNMIPNNGVSQYSANVNFVQQPIMIPSPNSNVVNVNQDPNNYYMNKNINICPIPQNIQVIPNGENISSKTNRQMNRKYEKPK